MLVATRQIKQETVAHLRRHVSLVRHVTSNEMRHNSTGEMVFGQQTVEKLSIPDQAATVGQGLD